MNPRYRALRGTRDILPGEVERWRYVETAAREVFERYGFREIRTPVLEAAELFTRSVGQSTDIVNKEMYTLERGGETAALRPEATAPVVRAFLEHSLHRTLSEGYPARYFYIGPMFRYERPQKGRQRQFHQVGAEVLGSPAPLVDAETIEMVDSFLDAVGVRDRDLLVGSVGDAACRPAFRDALRRFLEPRLDGMCGDCRRRYRSNPLRVFDCKVEADRRILQDAPAMLDTLCAPCRDHLQAVCSTLDRFGIPYRLERTMVRGLDYYQRTVFEVTSGRLGAQNSIVGGGRYDGLVEDLGGPAVPGFGFALGIERLLLLVPEERIHPPRPDVALVLLGEDALVPGITLARSLRRKGFEVVCPVRARPMGAQIKRASRASARYALFVGEEELRTGRFGLKDLASGEQVEVCENDLVERLGGNDGR